MNSFQVVFWVVLLLTVVWLIRRRRSRRAVPTTIRMAAAPAPAAPRVAAPAPSRVPTRAQRGGGLVIIDTETTGLSNDARVIELAWIVVGPDLKEVTKGSSFLRGNGSSGGASARAVHGISDRDLRTAPEFIDVWRTLDSYRAGRHLIAHNASFDRRMVNNELNRVHAPEVKWMACTMKLAKQLGYSGRQDGRDNSVALGALARSLRLEVAPTHRALADAETALALLRFIQQRHPDAVRQILAGER